MSDAPQSPEGTSQSLPTSAGFWGATGKNERVNLSRKLWGGLRDVAPSKIKRAREVMCAVSQRSEFQKREKNQGRAETGEGEEDTEMNP